MKRAEGRKIDRGFALPTVLIASVVMMMVLLSGLTASSSVNTAIREQFQNKMLKTAADSGAAMARACLEKGSAWTAGAPLRPNTDCSGVVTSGQSAYLIEQRNSSNQVISRSTFSVGAPTTDANNFITVSVTATVERVRGSSGTVYTTSSDTSIVRVQLTQWKDIIIVANGMTACGLTYTDRVYCWGDNTYGQLGDGTTVTRDYAVPIENTDGTPSTLRFTNLYGSWHTVCGLTTTQDAYCWGWGREGVMGNGDANSRSYPTRVSNGQNGSGKWSKLAMLNYTTCGIGASSTAGLIYCWGGNHQYNFGNGNTNASYTPIQSTGSNYTDIAGGSHHVCGIALSSSIWCWGLNVNSNAYWYCRIPADTPPAYNTAVVDCPGLGNRGFSTTTTYTGMNTTSSTDKLISGSDEVCRHEASGHLACFGANFKGQAGDYGYGPDDNYGTVGNRATIQNCVRNLAGNCVVFKSAQHGAFGVCGIDINDDAWCWGMGIYGMHGDGPSGFLQPANYNGGHVADGSHTLMGNNPVISSTYAVRVTGGLKFRKLYGSGGGYGYCGLTFDNKLYCWGRSLNGIFGIKDGTPRYYTSPTLAPGAIKSPPSSVSF